MLRRQALWIAAAVVVIVVVAAVLLSGRDREPSPTPSATTALASDPPASSAAASSAAPSASASVEPSVIPSASESPPESAAPSPPESAAPTPGATAIALPDTPVFAPLDQGYNTAGVDYEPADLGGLEPGDVTARWYVDGDRWVVHYDGLDLEATGPLCPGNSAQTSAGFEHVSNAPTAAGACESFDNTRAEAPVGVRRCGEDVLYLTAIPASVEGILFGSIETRYQTAGSVVGLTSMADPTAGAAPAIDLDALGCEVVDPAS
jgi:hypothetical protein